MNRLRHRNKPGGKNRPPPKALFKPRWPNPGRAPGGTGGGHVYPASPHCRHDDPTPDEEPGRYAAAPTLATGPGGEGGSGGWGGR